jgi:hypothetical protein
MRRATHAQRLGALFRAVAAAATAAGATGIAGSCIDASAEPCDVVARSTPDSCGVNEVHLAGPASACGFGDGGPTFEACAKYCGSSATCSVRDNIIYCSVRYGCAVDGRRPCGLRVLRQTEASLGAWFTAMSYHEHASAIAFAQLSHHARTHGLPRSLPAAMDRARHDELKHARAAATLARHYGGAQKRAVVRSDAVPTLFALALDNAREGCVRETFGALVAMLQAERAATRRMRSFYARIARDERRHAALSFRLHAALIRRLPPRQRRVVRGEMLTELSRVTIAASPAVLGPLGLPSVLEAAVLRSKLASALRRDGWV